MRILTQHTICKSNLILFFLCSLFANKSFTQVIKSNNIDDQLLDPNPITLSCNVGGITVTGYSTYNTTYLNPTNPAFSCLQPASYSGSGLYTSGGNGLITFSFSAPIVSAVFTFGVVNCFPSPDALNVSVNSTGILNFSNSCGFNINGNQLTCNYPVDWSNVSQQYGDTSIKVSSTIPFTSITFSRTFNTLSGGVVSHPCNVSAITQCLAGNNAPALSTTSINNVCPNQNVNLSPISTSNQPMNTTLTWHSTTPANGSTVITNISSLGAGTYYAAFYDTTNNCYSPTTAVTANVNVCTSDLVVSKSVNNTNPTYNSNVTFTIKAKNNGTSPATGVIVTDNLPTGYTLISATPSVGTWSSPNWTIGNLANGSMASLSIVAKVGCGNYQNTATITGNQIDPITSNNTSTVTINNPSPVLTATNDDFGNTPIIVCAGGNTASVFNNDSISCNTVNSGTVTASLINNGGITGATINSNGIITVPANTPTASYLLTYKICQISNTSNCATANVKIVVQNTINAINDDFTSTPINTTTGGTTASVLTNDSLNGGAINAANITVSLVSSTSIPGATINNLGIINVPAGTAIGLYVLTYKITDNLCTLNFMTATVAVYVSEPFIPTPPISNSIRANDDVKLIGVQSNGKIIISGAFTQYNNINKTCFARLNSDLTLDTSFFANAVSNPLYQNPLDLKIQSDDKIIVVGRFYGFSGGTNGVGIARLNPDGTLDTTFNVGGSGISGINNTVFTCAIQTDGKIIIGGIFDSYNGVPVSSSMVRLNPNGSIDPSFTYTDPVLGSFSQIHKILIQPDGKILVEGLIVMQAPSTFAHLIRLNPNGSIDTTFTPGYAAPMGGTINCVTCPSSYPLYNMALQPNNGKIIVTGFFNVYNGVTKNNIVRLTPNGTLDVNFNSSGSDRVIKDLIVEPTIPSGWNDPRIIIGGEFNNFEGAPTKKMMRLLPNGTTDNSFSIGLGTTDTGTPPVSNYICALHRQTDGKIIVGGSFTTFNGITAGNITRIQGDVGLQARSMVEIYNSEPEIDNSNLYNTIKIYPNPSQDIFNIDLSNEIEEYNTIAIYDILGEMVYKDLISPKLNNQINLAELKTGYYIAKISNETKEVQIKLIKN